MAALDSRSPRYAGASMSAPVEYVSSIAVDTVIEALGAFLQPFVGATQIVCAQVNRVPMPVSAFVELTEILQVDLETPTGTNDKVNQQVGYLSPKRIDIQVDFYGAASGEYCAAVKGVWRTPYATAQFPANIQPLYCSDGHQAPLVNGEEQYEKRWTLTASLQYNPNVIVPQQSATALSINVKEIL
jgi:hypothetical protein